MSAKPRLLDQVREALRLRHYSYRTEQQYVGWIRRFIIHHDRRHPAQLGGPQVEAFLSHLAVDRRVSAATQAQALAAVLFLYKHVLNVDLPWLAGVVRATRPKRLPVVLSRLEVRAVLDKLHDKYWLIASLLYGSGLRLMEALRLRLKDLNLEQRLIVVRDGKGRKDRVTIIPDVLVEPLRLQLAEVREQHHVAVRLGFAGVELPFALVRKYPQAHLDWMAVRISGETSVAGSSNGNLAAPSFTKTRCNARSNRQFAPPVSTSRLLPHLPPLLRHASHRSQRRYPHGAGTHGTQRETTQIYTHVLNRGGIAARSPLD
jgi:integron integrase